MSTEQTTPKLTPTEHCLLWTTTLPMGLSLIWNNRDPQTWGRYLWTDQAAFTIAHSYILWLKIISLTTPQNNQKIIIKNSELRKYSASTAFSFFACFNYCIPTSENVMILNATKALSILMGGAASILRINDITKKKIPVATYSSAHQINSVLEILFIFFFIIYATKKTQEMMHMKLGKEFDQIVNYCSIAWNTIDLATLYPSIDSTISALTSSEQSSSTNSNSTDSDYQVLAKSPPKPTTDLEEPEAFTDLEEPETLTDQVNSTDLIPPNGHK